MSAEKSNFDTLLATLNGVADEASTLAKSAVAAEADDKKVVAAAADAGIKPPVIAAAGGADAGAGDGDGDEDEDEGAEFGKSLGSDADGNPLVDATDLVKSLIARQDGTEGVLAKALETFTGTLKSQNDLIKSLSARVETLSGQGRGRKAVLAISEKPVIGDLAKSGAAEDEGKITPAELMAKSNAAYEAKKISGVELNTIDACLRHREPIPAALLQKVALAS